MKQSVVMLHGFGGTRRAWDGVTARLGPGLRAIALDLPGHGGETEAPRPISFAGCVEHVLARSPRRFALCGYSMGGRVALHVALAAPERVARLLLVSSTAGIEDAAERSRRRAADERLAEELERMPFERFIARWSAQPLFGADPPEVGTLARADQRRNRPEALAAVLRGLGTGAMRPLWDRLAELSMPVDILVGDRDEKFQGLARRLVDLTPRSRLLLVRGGHRLPLENPGALAAVLGKAPVAPSVPHV